MNLEQIAKQVSLLNRLIELLRMQEEPELMELQGWQQYSGYAEDGQFCIYYKHRLAGAEKSFFATRKELISHPLTQKAWGDELVKVARELEPSLTFVHSCLSLICVDLFKDEDHSMNFLEAILNKYGKSLYE